MTRIILACVLALALSGCAVRFRGGDDGMDGRGVAAAMRCIQEGTC